MNGQAIFKEAVRQMAKDIKDVLEQGNLALDDIDLVIPHQANGRIVDSVRDKFDGKYKDKFISLIGYYGNNSAASILIARHQMQERINKLRSLKIPVRILYVAFGLNKEHYSHGAVIEECYPF